MKGLDVVKIGMIALGVAALMALIMFAGPLIAIGDVRPLDNAIVRTTLCGLIALVAAAALTWKFQKRKKAADALAAGINAEGKNESDAAVLRDKMKDALSTLKTASGGRASYLYDLPWYLLIGPPGSGKTTALVNAGLKFPLARGATPEAIAGIGGTRYCDWWFTEDAVLIDTAGRYTTQDSDASADKQSWLAFLDLLKRSRPRQPINGVMVAISLEDLLTLSPAEITAHANAIRSRLLELHERLRVDFPVYALFTKGDLVAGFMEFFGHLGEQGRQQVWGTTFQTNDKTRNLVGEVPPEFDALVERLNQELTDRLQDEPAPDTRVLLFGFPTQMAKLKRPIFDFLNQIFEPTRYHANATLRGFYFTSGTQQGTPIDHLIGALAKSFGAEEVAAQSYSGLGKSYFLHDLIKKVIIGEAAWVSTDRGAIRRALLLKTAALTGIVLLAFAAAGVWWLSYTRNKALIVNTENSVQDYVAAAGPYPTQAVVADRDFGKILPLLHKLRNLPAGYAFQGVPTQRAATFGLSQRDRLQSAAETTYHVALERMFRSRLIFRMEEVLEAARNNPSVLYEALKVYMMLGGLQPVDQDLVLGWWRRDWAENLYPGAGNIDGRKALEEHLKAMLDLDSGEPLITLNGPLVEESQRTLARLSVSQRAYELLKSQARSANAPDWTAAEHGGPDVAQVFEGPNGPLDAVKVPGFFTYAGFQRAFIDRLGDVGEQVKKERWVLGPLGEQAAVAGQYDRLADDMLDLYSREFVAAWRTMLGNIKLKKLTADKPRYVALSAASSTTSPIRAILESIRDETALTRERPAAAKPAQPGAAPAATPAAAKPALMRQDRAPGAPVEAAFKPYHVLVEGDPGRKPVDLLIANLAEINQNLSMAAANPAQAQQANQALQAQVVALRNNAQRFPAPFGDMFRNAAADFEGDVARTAATQLGAAFREQIAPVCQQIVTNRYPFVRGSDRDVPLADFARLFSPNGIIDKFFASNVALLADTSKRPWAWKTGSQTARSLSIAALREFQRAAEIRDAFFSQGGAMPAINFQVMPSQFSGTGSAKLDINGTVIESKEGSNPPVNVQWPGNGGGRTALIVQTDMLSQPSMLERNGAWSLFRMLDAASPVHRGEHTTATFIVAGRELQYQFNAGTVLNPLNLPALREFRCPSGL